MSPGAFRLTFVYKGEENRLESATRVEMRAPKGDAGKQLAPNIVGNFLEVRDENARVLYRRAVQDFLPQDVEIHDGVGTPPRRVPTQQREGRFHFVIPAFENGAEAVLYVKKPDGEKTRTVEFARVKLPRVKLPRENSSDNPEGH